VKLTPAVKRFGEGYCDVASPNKAASGSTPVNLVDNHKLSAATKALTLFSLSLLSNLGLKSYARVTFLNLKKDASSKYLDDVLLEPLLLL
jgi:hypothetical protein